MAVTTLPLKPTYGLGKIDATIINTKNNKSVKLPLEFDTGTPFTALSNKYARTLGVDWDDGTLSYEGNSYIFKLGLKIGTLKPLITPVEIFSSKTNITYNTIGYHTIKQFKRISYNDKTILFEDNNPTIDQNMLRLFATYIAGTRTEQREGPYENIYYSHPVTFINKKNGNPVTIEMEVDTGTEYPTLPLKPYAKLLGIDGAEDAIFNGKLSNIYGDYDSYISEFTIQIGKLKPIKTKVLFIDTNRKPLLGLGDIIKKISVEISGDRLKYTELAALAEAYIGFYGYPRWHTKRI